MKKADLHKIWKQVPVTYYQDGVKRNFLQFWWHGHKLRSVTKIMSRLQFDKCLDVGCASGYMISEISHRFPNAKYYGVDVYDQAIAYAKKKNPHIKFRIASADKLPFKDKSMDLVLFYETIEHVEEPVRCLKEIKRVLKKGGTLILAMDSGSLLFRLVWLIWENTTGSVWKGAHLHPYHHTELERLIGRSRFKVDQKFFSFLGMEITLVLSK